MFLKFLPKYFYQYVATITGCLGVMSTGMHYGWAAPSLPVLQSPESPISPITNEQGSLVITMQEYGNLCGALIGAFIGDRLGRKPTILLTSPLIFLGWVLIAPYISLDFLMAGRFMAGITGGMVYTVIPMYLGEISNPQIRGLLSSLLQVSYVFGQLMFNIFGSLISIQVATYIACAVPLLQILTFSFMPESPYYLVMKQRQADAEKSLQKLNDGFGVQATLKEIMESVKDEAASKKGNKLELITSATNRRAVFITFGLRFFQQATGITAINFYVKQIFIDVDTGLSPSTISIIYFLLQFVMCSANSILIDKTGRKPLLYFSLMGTGISNAVLCVYFYLNGSLDLSDTPYKFVPVITILVYVIIFNIGLAATPMVLYTEFFNTKVKAIAMSVADMYFAILIITVSMFFQYTKDYIGIHIPFFSFSLLCALGLFFVYYFIPETKGMTLDEIQSYLKGTNREKKRNVIV